MNTPTHDRDENELLRDAEFERIHAMTKRQFDALSAATRARYQHTRLWHMGQRMQMPDVEAIQLGDRSYREVLDGADSE